MKTIKEMVEIMLAFDRGEQIEFKECDGKWHDTPTPIWNWSQTDYRVKPKSKYVPFETVEEFLTAQMEHGDGLVSNDGGLWQLKDISISLYGRVYAHKQDQLNGYVKYLGDLKVLFEVYKFTDGTPCGKEIET